jgi:hypothetical protein
VLTRLHHEPEKALLGYHEPPVSNNRVSISSSDEFGTTLLQHSSPSLFKYEEEW